MFYDDKLNCCSNRCMTSGCHSCQNSCCPQCPVTGPQGEKGETGVQGERGIPGMQGETGPAGPQGEVGPMGPQGEKGETGERGETGPAGPQGEVGPMGPQGEKGETGERGEAGPAGPQGEVGPMGPQGEKGATGERGETGLAGPQGEVGPMGPQGEKGATGERGETGLTGPQGEVGPMGPQGEKGQTGERGETGATGPQGEAGPIGPQGEVGATGPQGERGVTGIQGEAGPTGAQGEAGVTGPQGDRGPIAATIPFSLSNSNSSGAQLSTDANGAPYRIAYVGFGNENGYQMYLDPGEWNSGVITIREDRSYPASFVMPFNGTLQNFYGVFANRESLSLDAGVTIRPFMCLATGDENSLIFTIIQNSIVYFPPYVSGAEIPKYTIRRASLTDLGISLSSGTLITIIMGITAEGTTNEQNMTASISGGIFIE